MNPLRLFFTNSQILTVLVLLSPFGVYAQADIFNFIEPGKAILVVLIIVTIVVFIIRAQKGKSQKIKEYQVKSKINELRASGQDLHINNEEMLTEEDEQVLRSYVNQTVWASVIVLGGLGFVFMVAMDGIGVIIGLILLVIIFPVRKYMIKDLERVLQEGKKQVVRGIITDRSTTTKGTGKSRNTYYWLTIGEYKFEVTSQKYQTYGVGDAAEFHITDYPKGKIFIIRDKKLEGAGIR